MNPWQRLYWAPPPWGIHNAIWRVRVWWRPVRACPWGGRLYIDLQLGSRSDLMIQRRLNHVAELNRAMRQLQVRFTVDMRAFNESMARIGEAFRQTAVKLGAAMRPMAEALAELDQNLGLRPPTN